MQWCQDLTFSSSSFITIDLWNCISWKEASAPALGACWRSSCITRHMHFERNSVRMNCPIINLPKKACAQIKSDDIKNRSHYPWSTLTLWPIPSERKALQGGRVARRYGHCGTVPHSVVLQQRLRAWHPSVVRKSAAWFNHTDSIKFWIESRNPVVAIGVQRYNISETCREEQSFT